MRGKFIVIEGPDFCGKTTQVKLLKDYLYKRVGKIIQTREPGGTKLGECVRNILLYSKNERISMTAELFLYMASRAQLVEEIITPALLKGINVLCDRYFYSSIAYQGVAGNLGFHEVMDLSLLAVKDLIPDLVIILDIPPQDTFKRTKDKKDRIEKRGILFHKKVRSGFIKLAKAKNLGIIKVIDASQPIPKIQEEIRRYVDNVIL